MIYKNNLPLLVLSVFLISAQPAMAVQTVKGSVPKVEPLQPPPQNTSPNFQGNVEFVGQPATQSSNPGNNPSITPQSSSPAAAPAAAGYQAAAAQSASGYNTVLWIIILAVLCLGAWLLYRRKKIS